MNNPSQKSPLQEHFHRLINPITQSINQAFGELGESLKKGSVADQAVALDLFAAKCGEIAEGVRIMGERASQVASELLGE